MKGRLFLISGNLPPNKPVKIQPKHGIYPDNIVFFRLMTIFGLFPLHYTKNGLFELKWKSWQAIYTIIFIILGLIFSGLTIHTVSLYFTKEAIRLERFPYHLSHLVYPIMQIITILTLLRRKAIADYFNNWMKFLKRFEEVTGQPIPEFNATCWFLRFIFALCANIIAGIHSYDYLQEAFFEDCFDLNRFKALFFLRNFATVQIYLLITFLAVVATGCKTMSKALLSDVLKKNLRNKSVEDHMALWLNLRQLCNNFGDVFWMNYFFLSTFLFAIAVPSIYNSAVVLRNVSPAPLLITYLVTIFFVHIMAEIADGAANAIGEEFETELTFGMFDGGSTGQLVRFVGIVSSCPVGINLGGFFSLDRPLLVSVYSTLITFLIIIMQFRSIA